MVDSLFRTDLLGEVWCRLRVVGHFGWVAVKTPHCIFVCGFIALAIWFDKGRV